MRIAVMMYESLCWLCQTEFLLCNPHTNTKCEQVNKAPKQSHEILYYSAADIVS